MTHPFANGRRVGKLSPKYPYFGGHNQRSEKIACAIERKVCQYKVERQNVSDRRVKKTWKKYNGDNWTLQSLGRQERRLVNQWVAEACMAIDDAMLRNCI